MPHEISPLMRHCREEQIDPFVAEAMSELGIDVRLRYAFGIDVRLRYELYHRVWDLLEPLVWTGISSSTGGRS